MARLVWGYQNRWQLSEKLEIEITACIRCVVELPDLSGLLLVAQNAAFFMAFRNLTQGGVERKLRREARRLYKNYVCMGPAAFPRTRNTLECLSETAQLILSAFSGDPSTLLTVRIEKAV